MSKVKFTLTHVPIVNVATETPKDMLCEIMLKVFSVSPFLKFKLIPRAKLPQVVHRLFNEIVWDVELEFIHPICYGFILLSRSRAIFNASLGNPFHQKSILVEPL